MFLCNCLILAGSLTIGILCALVEVMMSGQIINTHTSKQLGGKTWIRNPLIRQLPTELWIDSYRGCTLCALPKLVAGFQHLCTCVGKTSFSPRVAADKSGGLHVLRALPCYGGLFDKPLSARDECERIATDQISISHQQITAVCCTHKEYTSKKKFLLPGL